MIPIKMMVKVILLSAIWLGIFMFVITNNTISSDNIFLIIILFQLITLIIGEVSGLRGDINEVIGEVSGVRSEIIKIKNELTNGLRPIKVEIV